MTEEKICPIMTSHDWVYCQKERCMAWGAKIEKCPNRPEGGWVDGCRLIP